MADSTSVSSSLATLGPTGWVTREDGTYGGSGVSGGAALVSVSRTLTATGVAGASFSCTPGETLKFDFSGASGITGIGVQVQRASDDSVLDYVYWPDGAPVLWTVPAGVTSIYLNTVLLRGSGSINLSVASA